MKKLISVSQKSNKKSSKRKNNYTYHYSSNENLVRFLNENKKNTEEKNDFKKIPTEIDRSARKQKAKKIIPPKTGTIGLDTEILEKIKINKTIKNKNFKRKKNVEKYTAKDANERIKPIIKEKWQEKIGKSKNGKK